MNYDLLESMGLNNIDLTYVFIAIIVIVFILMILVIVQTVKLGKLNKKYKKFMSGKSAANLEKDIMDLFDDNKLIKVSVEKNQKDIRTLYKKFESSFQKVGIIKYDAFNQMGGQLSFCLAVLDENNNGYLINSVHSSEGCYSYIKEINHGLCNIDLGNEEKKALDIAMGEDL